MTKYIYHYHAMKHLDSGSTKHFDGLLIRGASVSDYDSYCSAKEAISEGEGREGIIICSLTLLETAKRQEGVE